MQKRYDQAIIEHRLALDGRSLFDCQDNRIIITEGVAYGYEKKAVFSNNWKLIHSEGDDTSLLFDLSQDATEKNNLAQTQTKEVERLRAALPSTEAEGEALKVSKEVKEQLRNLGYF